MNVNFPRGLIILGNISLITLACSFSFSPFLAAVSSISAAVSFLLLPVFDKNMRAQFYALCKNPFIQASLLLIVWVTISAFYSTNTWFAGIHEHKKIIRYAYLLPFALGLQQWIWRRYAVASYMLGMFIILTLAYLKFFGITQYGVSSCDVMSLFYNRIVTSFLLSYFAFFLAHRCVIEKNKWQIIYFFLWLFTTFSLLYFNSSRTGYAVYLVLGILFLLQVGKHAWRIILFMTLCAAAMLLSSHTVFQKRVLQEIPHDVQAYAYHDPNTSIGYRLLFAKYSFKIIADHWLLGTGLAGHKQAYFAYDVPKLSDPVLRWGDPHNLFLYLWVDFGIIGLILFLNLLWQHWRQLKFLPPTNRYLSQGIIIALVAGGICDNLFIVMPTSFFYIFLTTLWNRGALWHTTHHS